MVAAALVGLWVLGSGLWWIAAGIREPDPVQTLAWSWWVFAVLVQAGLQVPVHGWGVGGWMWMVLPSVGPLAATVTYGLRARRVVRHRRSARRRTRRAGQAAVLAAVDRELALRGYRRLGLVTSHPNGDLSVTVDAPTVTPPEGDPCREGTAAWTLLNSPHGADGTATPTERPYRSPGSPTSTRPHGTQ